MKISLQRDPTERNSSIGFATCSIFIELSRRVIPYTCMSVKRETRLFDVAPFSEQTTGRLGAQLFLRRKLEQGSQHTQPVPCILED